MLLCSSHSRAPKRTQHNNKTILRSDFTMAKPIAASFVPPAAPKKGRLDDEESDWEEEFFGQEEQEEEEEIEGLPMTAPTNSTGGNGNEGRGDAKGSKSVQEAFYSKFLMSLKGEKEACTIAEEYYDDIMEFLVAHDLYRDHEGHWIDAIIPIHKGTRASVYVHCNSETGEIEYVGMTGKTLRRQAQYMVSTGSFASAPFVAHSFSSCRPRLLRPLACFLMPSFPLCFDDRKTRRLPRPSK